MFVLDQSKRFTWPDSVCTDKMYEQLNQMIVSLALLDKYGFDNPLSKEAFLLYLNSLLEGSRGNIGHLPEGSFALVPDASVPSDAVFEFIMLPTYVATATLSRVLLDYPEIITDITKYELTLTKALNFCCLTELGGHGYDRHYETLQSAEVLALGKIPLLMFLRRDLSAKLWRITNSVIDAYNKKLLTGDIYSGWSEADQSDVFNRIINLLKIKRDLDVKGSIAEAEKIALPFQGNLKDSYTKNFNNLINE